MSFNVIHHPSIRHTCAQTLLPTRNLSRRDPSPKETPLRPLLLRFSPTKLYSSRFLLMSLRRQNFSADEIFSKTPLVSEFLTDEIPLFAEIIVDKRTKALHRRSSLLYNCHDLGAHWTVSRRPPSLKNHWRPAGKPAGFQRIANPHRCLVLPEETSPATSCIDTVGYIR
ncbi:hypothetical protein BC938DRAFT_471093 [Jimgerdemannia flammicorona]|uniref:Uncharacterized protein n=1 Tax=Jimgerdemannia flammicorona TaxID=994334 RepID=A0A433QV23_9FUNG|nr:hypothetical protein BC938DRAFT_471093 [Jimgerdemannia flammicorona]